MIRSSVVLGVTFLIAVTESANYLGCFRERSLDDRLFKGDLKNFTTTNTHEVCIDHCRSNGFLYAGVQFGRQCFCSYERPSYEWLANSENECNMPCSGDKSQVCGAHRRMGVYSLVDPEPGSLSTSYIGCHAGGALREVMAQSADLSLERCKDFCEANRYRYFGAAEGSKCYCGNDIVSDNISERECRAPCSGDKTQLCGGSSEQLSVYRTSIPETETANYLGCFRERSLEDRLFKGDLQNFTTTNTHEVCIDHCRSNGFLYAGLQFGRQCFCSYERPSYEWLANSEDECNMPCSGDKSQVCGAHRRMGVYSLVDPEPGSLSTSYIGCHAGGALREVMAQSTDLSLERCKDVCEANRYRYFGAAEGSKCYCGNDIVSDNISERECRAPCGGDKTQLCGGTSEQLSVYRTSIPETETANYLGCFRERSLEDRLFKGDLQNFTTTNTHEVCIDHCRSKGFLYAGVQFGRQCFCSYGRPSYEWLANSEDDCNMPCSGDPSQVCGAHRRMGVYSLVDPEPGSLSTSYIGCHAGGALREVMAQSADLSLERCKDVCEANRYRYFGAAEGSKCFCGNDIVSDNISERECRAPCGGDKSQLCGGISEQLSVYRTSIPEPETANYLGCFRERSLEDRLFKGDLQNFTTTNTHEVCIDHCRSKGFLYAGVQFGRQCFCSYERPSYEWLANSEDECNMPCSGDPSQVCGAHRRMGVYSLVDPEPGSLSTSYIGCHAGGALREVMAQSADLSLEKCKDVCEANRYRYFGAAEGSKCYCGNDIESDNISERECRAPCGGDKSQLCGGISEQLSVYRTSIPETETANYLGCFRERSLDDRLFKGDLQNFTTTNTHEVCIDHCRSKGFLYAGVQFGRQCFCSYERPSYEWLANSENECNMPCSGDKSQVCGAHRRMGVYSLVDPEPGSLSNSYIGCHAGGALREVMAQSADLSLEKCKDVCEANRYRYFGAAEGSKCYCGNDIVSDNISERECRAPCGGDKTQLCGGTSEQLSVYRTSIPETETANYLGCFRERSLDDRLFKGDLQNFTTTNTHEVCIDHCRSKGFLYAGVQFGRQCFCSYERPSYEWLANSEDECNMPCSGDPSQVCGAHRRMGVYSLVDPEPGSLSTSYIGCHAGGALREVMAQSADLSLEKCKDVCEANRYRYFGAAEGSKCYCGNDIVSDNISERECRAPCGGDKTQLCGGTSEQLSVYRTSIPETETANYLGCFRERSLEDRLFKGDLQNFTTTNTHEVCIDHCRSNGFLYAGVQFGRQCFCSYERPSYEWLANSEDECNMPCSGDKSQVCGAHRRMGVYSLVDPEPGSLSTSYIGCHAGGALREVMAQSADLSLEKCKDVCEANRYRYFGAAEGNKCFCGNDIVSDNISERECRAPCGGDKSQLCGGTSEQLSVYRTSIPETETANYLGCFRERSLQDRLFKGDLQNFTTTNTHKVCIDHCRSNGFLYAGLQFGRQCFCSYERPSYEWLANSEDECNMPCSGDPSQVCGAHRRMGVYSLVDPEPGSLSNSYIGCHAGGALREVMAQSADLSLEWCKDFCEANRYRYFGTSGGSKCYCGNDIVSDNISERECRAPCGADKTQLCGGTSEQLSVYRTSIPDEMMCEVSTIGATSEESTVHFPNEETETWTIEIDTEPVTTYSTKTMRQTETSAPNTSPWFVSTTNAGPTEKQAFITTSRPVTTATMQTTEMPAATTTAMPVSTTTTKPTEMPEAYTHAMLVSTTNTRPEEMPEAYTYARPVSTTNTQPKEMPEAYTYARPVSTTTMRPTEMPAATTTAMPVSTTTTKPTEMPETFTHVRPVSTTTTRQTEMPATHTYAMPVSTTTTRPEEVPVAYTYARPVSTTTTRPAEMPAVITDGRPVSKTTVQPTELPAATTTARPVSTTTMRPTEISAANTYNMPVSSTTTRPTELPAATTTARPVSTATTRPTEIPDASTTAIPVSTTTTRPTEMPAVNSYARPVITTTRPMVIPTSNTPAWTTQSGKFKKGKKSSGSSEENKNSKDKKKNKKKSSSNSSSSEEKRKKKNKKSKEDKKNKKDKKKYVSKRSIATYFSHAIGCYKDEQSKLLPDFMGKLYSENTPRACVDLCGARNYSYAGVQRHECFCANKKPGVSDKTNIKNCDSPCPGDSLEICGGRGASSVFEVNS